MTPPPPPLLLHNAINSSTALIAASRLSRSRGTAALAAARITLQQVTAHNADLRMKLAVLGAAEKVLAAEAVRFQSAVEAAEEEVEGLKRSVMDVYV